MTEFVEVKTQDLSGAALNWSTFCAVYPGIQPTINVIERATKVLFEGAKPVTFPRAVSLSYSGAYGVECNWNPSGDWDCGGPLIEKYKLDIGAPLENKSGPWHAATEWGHPNGYKGDTPLVAACRAIVASVFGETVSVPKELLS